MESSETVEEENFNHKNDEFVHYQKINIIGDKGVGKSSFISYLRYYSNNNFVIEKELDKSLSMESYIEEPLLVEGIYRYKIDFNVDRNLYFNIYETNLNKFENIKKNLETILFQTECIIIMWDTSRAVTFDNIPKLLKEIESIFKKKSLCVPIFVLENKMDLKLDEIPGSLKSTNSVESQTEINLKETIEEVKKQENIQYTKISLFDKDEFYDLILKIYQKMGTLEKDTKKKGNNYLNFDVFDVKFKYPLQNLNNEDNNKVRREKCIDCMVLGNEFVGKKSFINILLEKDILDKSSIEDLYIFCSEINNEKYFLKINKIKEKNKSMAKSLYKKSDIFLLFYDVTNKESYEEIKNMLKDIIHEKGKKNDNYELLLIGNKIDINGERVIKSETAKKFADENNMRYFECSCSNKINIFEILNEIAIMAYRKSFNKKNDVIENKKDDNISIVENRTMSLEIKNKDSNSEVTKNKCCCILGK